MLALRLVRVFVVVGLSLLGLAACVPANASGATVLIVSPASIRAGDTVDVRATCGDNTNSAQVTSNAFGSLTLVPNHGFLMREVTVPGGTAGGTYNVRLACASGGTSTATLTVLGTGAHRQNKAIGPATGGGEMASQTLAHDALIGGIAACGAGVLIGLIMALRRPARRGIRG